MPAGSSLPPAKLAQVADMLRAGAKARVIADTADVAIGTVYGIAARLRSRGTVELMKKPVPRELRDAVLNAWHSGASLKEIAAATQRSVGTVGNIIFTARMDGDRRAVLRTYQRSRPALPTPARSAPPAADPSHKAQHGETI